MWEFIEDIDGVNVVGWDAFHGDDDTHMGSIYKHEDGCYWFEPSSDRIPLSSIFLKTIADKLSELNARK